MMRAYPENYNRPNRPSRPNNGNGNGNGNGYMSQEEMYQKLMELDFISLDIGLFLNSHPTEKEAITAYNQVVSAADVLRNQYEEMYGPLCSFRSYATDANEWKWEQDPWPWQKSANPSLSGKECM